MNKSKQALQNHENSHSQPSRCAKKNLSPKKTGSHFVLPKTMTLEGRFIVEASLSISPRPDINLEWIPLWMLQSLDGNLVDAMDPTEPSVICLK